MRILGFMLVATLNGPQRPSHQTYDAHKATGHFGDHTRRPPPSISSLAGDRHGHADLHLTHCSSRVVCRCWPMLGSRLQASRKRSRSTTCRSARSEDGNSGDEGRRSTHYPSLSTRAR